jgi:chaperonin cofactor prefoldin
MSNKMGEVSNSLQERLREVEEQLQHKMRQRGFEPDQVEVVALPGDLAKLYAEREKLRAELDEIKDNLATRVKSEQSQ